MSRYRSAGLVLAGVAVLAVAFVALRPGDDQETQPPAPTSAPADPTTAQPLPGSAAGTAEPEPEPPAPLLEPDSPRQVRVERGETVRLRVRSPREDEIHVHGYDLTREIAAGETVSMRFPADVEGIFEIELHRSGLALGELRVDP